MTTAPRVSVVIPFRNDERTLVAAIDSVCRQRWPAIELLLCNDHSDDASAVLASTRLAGETRIPWQMLQVTGHGAAAARNAGLAAMTGEWVAFLDADDRWEEQKLATCLDLARSHGWMLVAHAERWQPEDGVGGRTVRYRQLLDPTVPLVLSVYRQNPFSTSAVVMHRSLVEAAGPFDEELPSAEDFDYWLRVALVPGIRVGFVDDVLGTYTLRAGSESSRVDARHRAMLLIGDRYANAVRALPGASPLERWRYRSRVRLASGVRFAGAGRPIRGAALALAGLLQWPFRGDLVRYLLARRPS